jgi:hypothetical protein
MRNKLEAAIDTAKCLMQAEPPKDANRYAVLLKSPAGDIGFYDLINLAAQFNAMRHDLKVSPDQKSIPRTG